MQTFVIMRRGAWEDEPELQAAAANSIRVADEEMPGQVKWIRSYVLEEEDGTLGTVCIYQAEDADMLMEHAQRAEISADEILPVMDTVVVRDDP
ncbi:MAG TPA: nickel-binding protein [Xanthomonadales bacterium]|nr:nickel-binding protein [Xanthomonadales bacterium]